MDGRWKSYFILCDYIFLAKRVLENKTYQVLNQKCWLCVVFYYFIFILHAGN